MTEHYSHGFIVIRKSFMLVCFHILLVEGAYLLLDYLFRFFLKTPPTEVWFFLLFGLKVLFVLSILLRWYYDYYEVSHDKIEHYNGILLRRSHLFPASYIEMLEVKKDVLGALFGHGDIHMSSGIHNTSFVLKCIPDPDHHIRLVEKLAAHNVVEKVS